MADKQRNRGQREAFTCSALQKEVGGAATYLSVPAIAVGVSHDVGNTVGWLGLSDCLYAIYLPSGSQRVRSLSLRLSRVAMTAAIGFVCVCVCVCWEYA